MKRACVQDLQPAFVTPAWRRALYLSRFRRTGSLTVLAIQAAIALLLAGCGHPVKIRLPERYVMASTPLRASAPPETRLSPNGIVWTGVVGVPRDAGGNPIAAKSGVPPGIGTNLDGYLLAWFDPSGVLRSQTSPDGASWSDDASHGSFGVDQLSRPAVTFDYDRSRWVAAFRNTGGQVVIQTLRPASATLATLALPGNSLMPGLAFFNHEFVLAYRTVSGIQIVRSADGSVWAPLPGITATAGGSPIVSEGGPSLAYTLGTLFLSVNRLTPATPLSHGFVEVYTSGDALSWTLHKTFSPSSPQSRGAAVAGPQSRTVVADAGTSSDTMVWASDAARGVSVPTGTGLEASLAFGPKGSFELFTTRLSFRRFQRGTPEYAAREDVKLNVEHLDAAGNVLRRMPEWEVEDAHKHAVNGWNEGHGGTYPTFSALLAPGDSIRVRVDGDDGEVSGTLTFDQLKTNIDSLDCETPANRTKYTVWFTNSRTAH
jgi:hypothetical protein